MKSPYTFQWFESRYGRLWLNDHEVDDRLVDVIAKRNCYSTGDALIARFDAERFKINQNWRIFETEPCEVV